MAMYLNLVALDREILQIKIYIFEWKIFRAIHVREVHLTEVIDPDY